MNQPIAGTNKNSWIVILPVAAVAVAFVVWYYLPGMRAIAELRDQIRAKQDFVADSEKSGKALRAAKMEMDTTIAYVAHCRLQAPSEKELGGILAMIHDSANKAKVRITRFDPQPATAYEKLRRVPVSISLGGRFGQIHQFLRTLEEMPSYIWIASVKLDVDKKNGRDIVGEVVLVVFIGNSDISGCTVCSN